MAERQVIDKVRVLLVSSAFSRSRVCSRPTDSARLNLGNKSTNLGSSQSAYFWPSLHRPSRSASSVTQLEPCLLRNLTTTELGKILPCLYHPLHRLEPADLGFTHESGARRGAICFTKPISLRSWRDLSAGEPVLNKSLRKYVLSRQWIPSQQSSDMGLSYQ